MKFTVHTKELNKALNRLSAIRSIGPSAVTILADSLGGLFLQRDTTLVSMRIECPAEIEDDGDASVSFPSLHQRISKTSAEKVELKLAKDKLEIRAGSALASLVVWPSAHLCRAIPKPEGMPVTFQAAQLAEWLKISAVCRNDALNRPNLAGVCIRQCLGRIVVFGTDGRRIHCALGEEAFEGVRWREGETFDAGVLIPFDMAQSVERLLGDNGGDATLTVGDNTAQVSSPMGWIRFSTPVDGPPDLEVILSEKEYAAEIEVDRLALLEAVIAAAPSGFGDAQAITLRSVIDKLMVEANDGQGNEYKDFVEAGITSREHISLKVDSGFLIDFLKSLTGDKITLGYLADYHALACRQDDRYLSLSLMRETP